MSSEELKEKAKKLFMQGDSEVPATKMNLWTVSQKLDIPKSTLYRWAETDVPTWDEQKQAFFSDVQDLIVREDSYAVAKKEVQRINQIDELLDIVLPKIKYLFESATNEESVIRALRALGKSGAIDTLVSNSQLLKKATGTKIVDKENDLPENWSELPTEELQKLVEIE